MTIFPHCVTTNNAAASNMLINLVYDPKSIANISIFIRNLRTQNSLFLSFLSPPIDVNYSIVFNVLVNSFFKDCVMAWQC